MTQPLIPTCDTDTPPDSVWLFGYGSLIYKVDFDYLERRPASIRGWVRRFWQGSHDHRGTPDAPGRVVTLVPDAGAVCAGMAYRIAPQVFAHLDHREKNGYVRLRIELHFTDADDTAGTGSPNSVADGVVYIAAPDNEAFLGAASTLDIARHVAASHGPSGANRDYVLQLAQALRALQVDDAHVFEIEKYLREADGSAGVGFGA